MADKNKITMLGAGTFFSGEISVPGSIHIAGKFEGKISCDGTLAIGESGEVKADIKTHSLEIDGGKVIGRVECKNDIQLRKKAEIRGDITARELIIDKGCIFHGNSVMLDKKGKPVAEPVKKVKETEKAAEAELELEELK